jgi:hypothetical protein
MTTNRQPRRLRRQSGERDGAGAVDAANLSVSERLRGAREARGIDLFRVERDTKIRMKYLTAMEQGAFDELPADVYARGFLRNYASYLGLDPDEAEGEWRRGNLVPRVKMPPVRTTPEVWEPEPAPIYDEPAARAPRPKTRKAKAAAEVPPPVPARGAAAPAFKLFGFALPAMKWPTMRPVDPAPLEPGVAAKTTGPAPAAARPATATTRPLPAAPKAPLANPSILESPPAPPRRSFAAAVEALLGGRRDAGLPPEPVLGGPQPITVSRRSFVLQPTHVVLLLMAVVIVAVGLFFANQAKNSVLQNPTLTVTSPAGALETVDVGATTYVFVGTATPKAEISISWDQRDPNHAVADAKGHWQFSVTLHNGINRFDIWSTDLATGHDSKPIVTDYINVPTPSASPVPSFLSVDSPTEGQGFSNGNITVTGTSVEIASVTVMASYVGPAPFSLPTPKPTRTPGPIPTAQATLMPVATVTPVAVPTPTTKPKASATSSINPAPVTVTPFVDGKYSAPLQLPSGRWKITVIGTGTDGFATDPIVRNIIVTAGSLVVLFQVRGGNATLKIWKDGKLTAAYGGNGTLVLKGTDVKIVANQSVWFYSTAPYDVLVTVNGVPLGRLTTSHTPASWRITAFGAPTLSNDR